MNSYIITASGRRVHLFKPTPGEISVGDIAHSLGNLCRFTGHSPRFYSVAEHSCLVHDAILEDHPQRWMFALVGLMHDAAEAYIGDIATPLKRRLVCEFSYADSFSRSIEFVERTLLSTIFRALGITDTDASSVELLEEVKAYDKRALEVEMLEMFGYPPVPSEVGGGMKLRFWDPKTAADEFLRRLQGAG